MKEFIIHDSCDGLGELKKESNYICLVTDSAIENYLEKQNMYNEIKKASSIGCNMYAMVQRKTMKPEIILDKYDWSGVYYFDKDSELKSCAKKMKRDIYNREFGK